MPEELGKADVLLRIVSKAIDILLIAAAWELLPKAGFIAGIFYLLISDGLFRGSSIGKKVIGLQVISLDSKREGAMKESILRNLPLALGLLCLKIPLVGWLVFCAIFLIELILVIGSEEGARIGDMLAKTVVVVRDQEIKEKEEADTLASP